MSKNFDWHCVNCNVRLTGNPRSRRCKMCARQRDYDWHKK